MTGAAVLWMDGRSSRSSEFIRWVKAGFFDGPVSTCLTLLLVYVGWRIAVPLYDWAVRDSSLNAENAQQCVQAGGACWAFLRAKARLILFGTYPYDEQWRPATALGLFAILIGLSCWPRLRRPGRARHVLAWGWLAVLAAIAVLMHGGFGLPVVDVRLWAGLPLTVLIASLGIFLAFWLGILLALGRRSQLPVIRWTCTVYIEVMRGVPLISLLFIASIMFPLIVPPEVNVDKLVRAQAAFTLFYAAYLAEAIRGGLQAIPAGQYQAATALGLHWWQQQRLVILPQALRLVVPSLVNLFIAAFKDTSLVIVISMLDLLGTANAAMTDARWWGLYVEAYLFVGVIYFLVCLAMSRYSQFVERRLASGAAV